MTHLPHRHAEDLLPGAVQHLECMQNFAGMLEYLCSRRWAEDEGIVKTAKGFILKAAALPLSSMTEDRFSQWARTSLALRFSPMTSWRLRISCL